MEAFFVELSSVEVVASFLQCDRQLTFYRLAQSNLYDYCNTRLAIHWKYCKTQI